MAAIAFLDCETTGLDAGRHQAWDIAVILRHPDLGESTHQWFIRPDLARADPAALRIGRYYERTSEPRPPGTRANCPKWADPAKVAAVLAPLLDGAVICGANPSFDAAFIGALLRGQGHALTADYHLLDIGSLVTGWSAGRGRKAAVPLKLTAAAEAAGVDHGQFDAHTALGDAMLARAIWDAVTGGGS